MKERKKKREKGRIRKQKLELPPDLSSLNPILPTILGSAKERGEGKKRKPGRGERKGGKGKEWRFLSSPIILIPLSEVRGHRRSGGKIEGGEKEKGAAPARICFPL